MTQVHFDEYPFRIESRNNSKCIFDIVRKKLVTLTPEEWVRQHVLHYLAANQYPLSHIAVERGIVLNGLRKRFDIVVFDKNSAPAMIVECKAPEETLNEKVFEQIARYNLSLKVNYLWVTNGANNYCCKLNKGVRLLPAVPAYQELEGDKPL